MVALHESMVGITISSQSNINGGVAESSRSPELLNGPCVKLLTFSKVKNELSVFNSNIISPPKNVSIKKVDNFT